MATTGRREPSSEYRHDDAHDASSASALQRQEDRTSFSSRARVTFGSEPLARALSRFSDDRASRDQHQTTTTAPPPPPPPPAAAPPVDRTSVGSSRVSSHSVTNKHPRRLSPSRPPRPLSAFDSDSSDDEEDGRGRMILGSIRSLVGTTGEGISGTWRRLSAGLEDAGAGRRRDRMREGTRIALQ